jgi:NarL family two-component system response regulator LiaR
MTTTEANVYIVTPRQMEVLIRLADGKTNDEIADEMNFSDRTIKDSINEMFISFGVSNRTGLVAKALRAGVIK